MKAFDRWLFAPGAPRHLAVLRLGLAAVILLRITTWPFRELANTPDALFDAPWYLAWTGGYPPAWVFVAIQAVGALACASLFLKRRARVGSVGLVLGWLCLLVLAGYKTSTGKILHNDVLLLLAAAPVLLHRGSVALDDRRPNANDGWPLRAALLTTALVYVFCGVQKLRHTGPEWVFSDNMQWILDGAVRAGRAPTNAVSSFILEYPILCVGAAAGIMLVELGFPIALVWSRAKPFVAAAAVALHTLTWLTLGLDYWAWSLTAALVLLVAWRADQTATGSTTKPS